MVPCREDELETVPHALALPTEVRIASGMASQPISFMLAFHREENDEYVSIVAIHLRQSCLAHGARKTNYFTRGFISWKL